MEYEVSGVAWPEKIFTVFMDAPDKKIQSIRGKDITQNHHGYLARRGNDSTWEKLRGTPTALAADAGAPGSFD